MSVQYTQEDFEEMARKVHGDMYDYSHDRYTGMNSYYKFYCEKHGIFEMKPASHIHSKNRCPCCAKELIVENNKQKHLDHLYNLVGDEYTIADWLDFSTAQDNVVAHCQRHGDYKTPMIAMFNTSFCGCQKCRLYSEAEKFIKKALKVHGNKYSYNAEDYICSRTHMKIWCNTHNNYFYQRPSAHIQGQGCPLCGQDSRNKIMTKNEDDFLHECTALYADKYNYNKVEYKGARRTIVVTCPFHGDFLTNPAKFLGGAGCPICSKENTAARNKFKFIQSSKDMYGEFAYDYSKVQYVNNRVKVTLKCNIHNEWFEISPNKHLNPDRSGGCPVCSKLTMNRWSFKSVKKIPNIDKEVGFFYIGTITSLKGLKIGVTKNLNHREEIYRRDLCKYEGIHFNYKSFVQCSYLSAFLLESLCKDLLKSCFYNHHLLFGGKNEIYRIPSKVYSLITDIINGRFSLEIDTLANTIEGTKDPQYKAFLYKLEKEVL